MTQLELDFSAKSKWKRLYRALRVKSKGLMPSEYAEIFDDDCSPDYWLVVYRFLFSGRDFKRSVYKWSSFGGYRFNKLKYSRCVK